MRRCRMWVSGSRLAAVCGAGALTAAGLHVQSAAAEAAQLPSTAQRLHQHAPQLPTEKLACRLGVPPPRTPTVLVSCGSFNPPTNAHMRMFDVARDALVHRGIDVWGGYISPVGDAYAKPGLAPVQHRLALCRRAAQVSDMVMVDEWEAMQPKYTRTLQVLRHIAAALGNLVAEVAVDGQAGDVSRLETTVSRSDAQLPQAQVPAAGPASASSGLRYVPHHTSQLQRQMQPGSITAQQSEHPSAAPRVMLLCGADMLATMAQPGVWQDPGMLLEQHGVVCIARDGAEVEQLLQTPGTLLHEHKDNIILVQDPVPNSISSTRVRAEVAAGRSIRYLVPDAVAGYISWHRLYCSVHSGN